MMPVYANIPLIALIGYAIGNFSPAAIIGLIKGYNIHSEGSGNAGASNTVILGGKRAGLLVAVLDIIKAWVSWKIAEAITPALVYAGAIGGAACTLGHMYPAVMRFKGGKGFACLGGIVLAGTPKLFLAALLLAIFIAFASNYICISTCLMWIICPAVYGWLSGDIIGGIILLAVAPLVIVKHLPNFARIKEGGELKMSFLFNKAKELKRIGREEKE